MNPSSSPTRRIQLIAWVMLAMYLGLAVTLTHIPKPPSELVEHFADKTLHCVGYFVYGALFYIAMGLTFPRVRFLWLIVIAMLGIWAALDELTQPLFHRDCDILDWRADMIGVSVAVISLSLLRWVAMPKRRRVSFS